MLAQTRIPELSTEPTPGYWVHDLDPFLIKFPEGFFLDGIRWYGLAYLAGFLFGAIMLGIYFKKGRSPLNSDAQSSFLFALFIGVLLGGRLGYMLFYSAEKFFSDPLLLFKVWQGGMASHGGIIGAILATAWTAKKYKCSFLRLCDIITSLAPAGIFFGRCANFINGELWGKETTVPWAVVFPWKDFAPDGNTHIIGYLLPRHPSQIYAATLEGLLMLAWTQFRFWHCKHLPPGRLIGESTILYAIIRVINEQFREPDLGVSFILGMSRGQFYSLLTALAGIAFIIASKKYEKSNSK